MAVVFILIPVVGLIRLLGRTSGEAEYSDQVKAKGDQSKQEVIFFHG
jgi:hypothetical protein